MRRSEDFARTIRSGARAGGRRVVVHLGLPVETPAAQDVVPALAGLVVSRAIGPAVTRTRVKRRLRHVLAPRVAVLPPGSRLVVRALPAARDATSADLAVDLDRALARLQR